MHMNIKKTMVLCIEALLAEENIVQYYTVEPAGCS